MMALFSRWMIPNYQCVTRPRLPSPVCCHTLRMHQNMPLLPSPKIGNGMSLCSLRKKYALSVGRDHQLPNIRDDFHQEPFWSNLLKNSFWSLKSLVLFLVEQPSQLKYIEWPSFQSTLKTATFTLLLVGLFIVALSSVDSALYYILALLSRRHA